MPTTPFKLTIHMVSSVDGYIAKKDNSVSWFETADTYADGVDVTAQQAADFLKTIDCYLMGANTYLHALQLSETYGWAYGDVPTIVLTHRALPVNRPNIKTYSGSLIDLVNEQLKPHYKNVWLVGGPKLAKDFITQNLADEIRQSVLPIILGDGLPFFDHTGLEKALHLQKVTAYKSGMVELCYEIRK